MRAVILFDGWGVEYMTRKSASHTVRARTIMQQHSEEHAAERTPAKIIPLRRDPWYMAAVAAYISDAERGRHFLKVTLPALPVAVFTLTFLFGYLLALFTNDGARSGVDPLPALIGALAITALTSLLCIAIYSGYRHVAGLRGK